MTMTHERYPAAFATAAEREAFFQAAQAGRPVEAGTAMKHVIASNSALWLDETALAADVARILKHELDTWCDNEGEARIALPAEVLLRCETFRRAFAACLVHGRDDMDDEVTRLRIAANPGLDIPAPPQRPRAEDDAETARALSPHLLERVYAELCRLESRLRRDVSDRERGEEAFRARVSRLGLDPDDLPDLDAPSPRGP